MPQGVKVVNPMMGGDFDVPDDDEPASPVSQTVQPAEPGEAHAEVRRALMSLLLSLRPLPFPPATTHTHSHGVIHGARTYAIAHAQTRAHLC